MVNLFDVNKKLKEYKPIPAFKKFKFYFKMMDMYALPITLRYKNQQKFFTNFGALTSLFVYLSVLVYLMGNITETVSDPTRGIQFQSNAVRKQDLEWPDPGDKDHPYFFLGLRLTNKVVGDKENDYELKSDPLKLYLKFSYGVQSVNNSEEVVWTEVPLQECKETIEYL